MSNAKKDSNGRPTIITASKNDGTTVVAVMAVPTTHALKIDNNTTGNNNGNNTGIAMLDENSVPVWTALSSTGDGSIVEVYGDPATGALLINSS